MTDLLIAGHSVAVLPSPETDNPQPLAQPATDSLESSPDAGFAEVYQSYFDFVWRSLRRVGIPAAELDDAVQEVFLVVHRRLDDFEGRSSMKTWLFGIVLRVASQHRRRARRHPEHALPSELGARELAAREPNPHEAAVQAQALELVYELLETLDDDKRTVLVLAELEQMTAREIAEALGLKLNTVYSRLRAARREFDAALSARKARDARRHR